MSRISRSTVGSDSGLRSALFGSASACSTSRAICRKLLPPKCLLKKLFDWIGSLSSENTAVMSGSACSRVARPAPTTASTSISHSGGRRRIGIGRSALGFSRPPGNTASSAGSTPRASSSSASTPVPAMIPKCFIGTCGITTSA